MLFNSSNVHLDQHFSSEKCNTATTKFHQQFSSTKQFTTYLAIPTRKFVFSFIQLSYLPQVNNFKLLNINERKFKQSKQEMKKIKVNTKLCKEFYILLNFLRMGYLVQRGKDMEEQGELFFTP